MVSFEDALRQWSNVNFNQQKSEQHEYLKKAAEEEVTMLSSRRNLIKRTKEVKQLSEEEQAAHRPELLKIYQHEIDSLSGIVKNSHAALRQMVEMITNLPDPMPIIQICLEQSKELTDFTMLQQENEELKGTMTKTLLELKELHGKLGQNQKLVDVMKSQFDEHTSLVNSLKSDIESKDSAIDELSIALADMEKDSMINANRLQETIKRNEELNIEFGELEKAFKSTQNDLKMMREKGADEDNVRFAEFELLNMNLTASRKQVAELQREIELRNDQQDQNNDIESILKDKERTIKGLESQIDRLAEELKKIRAESFKNEKLLEELKIIKATEFPNIYDQTKDQPLGILLKEKTKKLEIELTTSHREQERLQKELERSIEETGKCQMRVSELERSIGSCKEATTNTLANENGLIRPSGTTSMQHPYQKDLLKKKIGDSEERSSATSQLNELQTLEINKLQADNLKLFERIRFLEAHQHGKKTSAREPPDAELGELLGQYQSNHEDRFDLVKLFFHNGLFKRFKRLGQTDRAVWKIGKVFLTNKFIRQVILVYFAILHLVLIYIVLFKK